MRVFGKRTVPPPGSGPVASGTGPGIAIKQSAYRSGDSALVQGVLDFVNFAIREAKLDREQVAPNAMRSYHADFYLAQVSNGGHGQYAHNSRMEPRILGDCQDGLDAMGHGAGQLHVRMIDLARREPARMAAVAQAAGFGKPDPLIAEIDAAFYRLERTTSLTAANARWLRSLPELQVVDDADYPALLRKLAPRDPAVLDRAEPPARPRGSAADPMKVALDYLGMMVPKPFIGFELVGSVPGHDLGDGVKLVRFLAECEGERYSAFFHPKMSLLYTDHRPPLEIARVPTEMVANHVRAVTGQDLMRVVAVPGFSG